MPKRIVLTGGPGGGKTTAADLIRRELGTKVVVVPEAATILFAGGFPRKQEKLAVQASQRAIYHVQKNMEDVQYHLYPKRTLLCDRGTLDGAVYWPGQNRSFFQAMGTSIKKEMKRYDAVIFFESAAVGNLSIEGGNPVRTESNKEAIEIDLQLKRLWMNHPNFYFVSHEMSFLAKMQEAVKMVQALIKN